jgi:ribose transport system permease protein
MTNSVTESSGAARAADTDAQDMRPVGRRRQLLSSTASWIVLLDVVLIVFFTMFSQGHIFWSKQDFQSLALNGSEGMLLALAMTILLSAALFDLSVGSNLVLSSVIGAKVMLKVAGPPGAGGIVHHQGQAILAGLIACLAVGLLFGLVNGLLIAYLDINSLIATLGTLGIGTGAALLLTNGADIASLPPDLQSDFALKSVFTVPEPAIIALGAAVLLWLVIRYLRYGTRTLAIGSSRPAAERAGMPVKRHIISLFLLAGILAGMAGFIDIAHYAATTINGHTQDALTAVTATVIGGTALEGGRVSIGGTVAGSILAIVLLNGLVIVGVQSFWQLIAVGCVLIVAVALDRFRYKHRTA